MSRTATKERIERYEVANADAALIVLSDPERYQGGLLEWAELVAYRLATSRPDRYPQLTQAWATYASEQAFYKRDCQSDQASPDELEDGELKSWNRR
jgi:hypothetical protein